MNQFKQHFYQLYLTKCSFKICQQSTVVD